jgi:hypothetical protein
MGVAAAFFQIIVRSFQLPRENEEYMKSLIQRKLHQEGFVGLLDGAMYVWAVLYRATRIKTLCIGGSYWNQGE